MRPSGRRERVLLAELQRQPNGDYPSWEGASGSPPLSPQGDSDTGPIGEQPAELDQAGEICSERTTDVRGDLKAHALERGIVLVVDERHTRSKAGDE